MNRTAITTPTASNVLAITMMLSVVSVAFSLALYPMLSSMAAIGSASLIGTCLILLFLVEYLNVAKREHEGHYQTSIFAVPLGMAFLGATWQAIPDIHIPVTITASLFVFWLLVCGKAKPGKDRGFDIITLISMIGITANSACISAMLVDPSTRGKSVFFGELLQVYLILHGLSYVVSMMAHLRAGSATRGAYAHTIGFMINIGLVFTAVQMLRMI